MESGSRWVIAVLPGRENRLFLQITRDPIMRSLILLSKEDLIPICFQLFESEIFY